MKVFLNKHRPLTEADNGSVGLASFISFRRLGEQLQVSESNGGQLPPG